jgi:catechol 2,3-dioxygenase-like lactoylglutathione lyase family enzyme
MQLFGFRLLTDDFPAALRFWRDVVKLPLAFGDESMGYAYFGTDHGALELFSRAAFASAVGDVSPAGRGSVVLLKTDDVDGSYATLIEGGATSIAAPQDRPEWRARTAHVADPDGHLIEIYSSLGE